MKHPLKLHEGCWSLYVASQCYLGTNMFSFISPHESFDWGQYWLCPVCPVWLVTGGVPGSTTAATQAGRTRSVTICPSTTDLSRSHMSGPASPAGEWGREGGELSANCYSHKNPPLNPSFAGGQWAVRGAAGRRRGRGRPEPSVS